ncbi:hypothetical protein [Bogoriella caseilytica]|uniref:Lipoprotein n=1 Tax=Bogoriella caseilytica TaxID=56055 RepID=A0A3N2BF85_9MICO|nr:hypothetical protein [Bogoriella caseilytica]ROR73916.1 hypothetical protein EDD31_2311 [Bogoriella caseilytica]
MTIGRTRASAVRAAVMLTGVAVLAAGCFADSTGREHEDDDPVGGSDTEISAEAEDVLERYGIALPDSASTPQLELLPENAGREEGYRLSFTMGQEEAEQLCTGINGPGPAASLTESDAEVLGVEEPPEGARLCFGSRPDHGQQQIRVLYAGDPAEVTLALYLMPTR